MITKVSCYNQTFTAAGLPMGRIGAAHSKPSAFSQGISAADFIKSVRHCDCKLGTGIGSILGAGAAFFAALATKADGPTWLTMHSGGMLGGGALGRKVHHWLAK